MAITNASRLADFGSGIGTAGAVLQIYNANDVWNRYLTFYL